MTLVPESTVAVVGSNIDKSNNYVFFKKIILEITIISMISYDIII
jgi:hypothetical protein